MQLHFPDRLSQPQSPARPPRPSLDSQHLRQQMTPTEAYKWSVTPERQTPILPRLRPPVGSALVASTSSHLIPGRMVWLGGWLLAFCTVALGSFQMQRAQVGHQNQNLCQTVIHPGAALSRAQLAQLLTVPERSPQSQIRDQVAQPYCQLADLEVRAEVMAQREAYPLAFDPQTWLILLFEGEEYAGYAFAFQP